MFSMIPTYIFRCERYHCECLAMNSEEAGKIDSYQCPVCDQKLDTDQPDMSLSLATNEHNQSF